MDVKCLTQGTPSTQGTLSTLGTFLLKNSFNFTASKNHLILIGFSYGKNKQQETIA